MSVTGAIAVPHPPIMIPAVGRGEEQNIAATIRAYREAAQFIAAQRPDIIVITSPHSVMYADYFHISPGAGADGDLSRFGAGDVRVHADYDTDFVRELSSLAEAEDFPAGTLGEQDAQLDHGTLIPLYFLQQAGLSDVKIVRTGLSGLSLLDHYHFGQLIGKTADRLQKKTAIVASGDLSHKLKEDGPYGYAPEGPEFDRKTVRAFETADFLSLLELDPGLCAAAAECGLRSFVIMAGALDEKAVHPRLLSYEGPFGVGYSVAVFSAAASDPSRRFALAYEQRQQDAARARKDREDVYVRLARTSLETYLRTGRLMDVPDHLPDELIERRAGAFVSLKKYGQLRGCIGTIGATRQNIAQEIIRNAVSAGTEDPRFAPVTAAELPDLTYSVDILGEAQPVSSPEELDAKEYGVIVTNGSRRGLLLPNLEGVDTPQQQIEIALGKAGIRPGEPYDLEKFKVVRHR